MTDISSHPLLQQAYGVCQAIEQCGASPELTRAVGRASDLLRSLDDHLKRDSGSVDDSSAAKLREDLTRDDQIASFLHAWDRDGSGRPRKFSNDAKAAMRLVESLINAGDIALAPDRWCEDRMHFTGAPLRDIDKPDEQVSVGNPIQREAMSFMLDPLEQAIESTARVLRDEHEHLAQISMAVSGDVPLSPVYKRMSAHLEALLSAQLKRVGDDEHQ